MCGIISNPQPCLTSGQVVVIQSLALWLLSPDKLGWELGAGSWELVDTRRQPVDTLASWGGWIGSDLLVSQ